MSRFEQFTDEELKLIHEAFSYKGTEVKVLEEIKKELEYRKSPEYKSRQPIVAHLKKLGQEGKYILSPYVEEQGVYIWKAVWPNTSERSVWYYYSWKGGIYSSYGNPIFAIRELIRNEHKPALQESAGVSPI